MAAIRSGRSGWSPVSWPAVAGWEKESAAATERNVPGAAPDEAGGAPAPAGFPVPGAAPDEAVGARTRPVCPFASAGHPILTVKPPCAGPAGLASGQRDLREARRHAPPGLHRLAT